MSKEIQALLNRPDRGIESAQGVLPKLARKILMDLNYNNDAFNRLMIKYLNDPRNGMADDAKKRSSERSNMMKELLRPTMTFKVFLKFIKFISPLEARIDVSLKFHNRTTVHSYNLGRVSETTLEDLIRDEPDLNGSGEDEDDEDLGNDTDRDY